MAIVQLEISKHLFTIIPGYAPFQKTRFLRITRSSLANEMEKMLSFSRAKRDNVYLFLKGGSCHIAQCTHNTSIS